MGDCGLLERTLLVRGEENVRSGRGLGRTGVCVRSEIELEDEDEERTEAFLLRSARLGDGCRDASGEGVETCILSMRKKESKENREEDEDEDERE